MSDLVSVLRQAGFKGKALRTAYAIAMRESGGRPEAFNGNTGTGDRSWGLFQINTLGPLKSRVQQYGLQSEQDLLDPANNARAAYQLSKGGTDFGAWGIGPNAYRSGAGFDTIKKYYDAFPGASSTGGYPAQDAQPAVAPTVSPPAVPRLSPEQVFGGGSLASLFGSLSRQRDWLQSQQPAVPPSSPGAVPAKSGALKAGGGWGGSRNIAKQLASIGLKSGLAVSSEKRTRKLTASGNPSDHWTGSKQSYAYDLSGNVENMDRSAAQILSRLGIEWDGKSAIVENKIVGNHRIQILYRTNVGGNHWTHIHVGVRKL
jgi:hypothetical protein